MKIDYINFLLNKPQETDRDAIRAMYKALVPALKKMGVHGHISCVYYKDGRVKVSIDGEYYNMFDSNTGKFFSGSPGDF